jgi:hypothetical protein
MDVKKLAFLALGLNFVVLALLCFWADSEAWPVKVASLSGHDRSYYDYSIKPLYMILLSPIVSVSKLLQLYHMYVARFLFALNGLLIVYLGKRLVSKLTRSETLATSFVVFMLTSSLYLERGFRVRSDHLGTVFVLISLLAVLSHRLRRRNKLIALFVLSLLAAATTPKSLLVLACFAPFFWRALVSNPSQKLAFDWLLPAWLLLFVVVTFAVFMGQDTFQHLWSYGTGLLSSSPGDLPPLSLARFQYVFAFPQKNPVLAVLFVLNTIAIFYVGFPSERPPLLRAIDFSFLGLLLLILVFPNRLPFFLASLLPLLLVGSLSWGRESLQTVRDYCSQRFGKILLATVFAVQLGFAAWTSFKIYSQHNNLQQMRFVTEYSSYLSVAKNKKAYDPSGLLPNENLSHLYLGPGQTLENRRIAYRLQKNGFNFLFLGQRVAWISLEFTPDFLDHSKVFPPGLMLVGDKFMGEIKQGVISGDDLRYQIVMNYDTEAMQPERIYLRNLSKNIEPKQRSKMVLRFGDIPVEYSEKGMTWNQLLRLKEVILPPGSTDVVVFVQDFPIDKTDTAVQKLLAFDRWL